MGKRTKAVIICCCAVALVACCLSLGSFMGADFPASSVTGEDAVGTEGTAMDVLDTEGEAAVAALVGEQEARQAVGREGIPAVLAAACEANPDVCSWLYVPGTNVSLAVVRHPYDDSYYMAHGVDGGACILGSAFMEQANSPAFDDPVTVLYAHSFSDADVMFTGLHRFEDARFFAQHDSFSVYLPDRVLDYRIIGATFTSDACVLDSFDFTDPEAAQTYFDAVADDDASSFAGLKRRTAPLDAASNRIVQLSTCTLPAAQGARYVVIGVLVDDGQ